MPRKRKVSDWSRRCRFCLSLEPSSSELFVDNLNDVIKDVAKCTDIQITEEPSYPKKICYACHYKLNMWIEFKTKFINSHKSIISYVNVVNQNATESESTKNVKYSKEDLFPHNEEKQAKLEESSINSPQNAPETSPAKSQSNLCDSSTSTRKLTRSRKQEQHEKFTKRWVQRKNALKVARGEESSESDSDDHSNLSPIQKVQADTERRKRLEKALKNLETNLTDKYKLTYTDDGKGNPVRRTRRVRVGETIYHWKTAKWLTEWVNEKQENEKLALLEQDEKTKIETIEKVMGKSIHEIDTEYIREFEKANNVQLLEPSIPIDSKKYVDFDESSVPDITKKYTSDDPEPYVPMSVQKLKLSISKDNTISHNNSEINDKSKEIENNPAKDLDIVSEQIITPKKPPFEPQTVTVELSIGQATYIVTTTLDLPSSIGENTINNNLISNGLSAVSSGKIDTKNDVMNAVQLQRIKPNEENSTEVKQPSEKIESQRCLKIEVEGLEAQALQRVQLSLANFITNEVPHLLTNQSSFNKRPKKPKFKDAYDSLEHQLRSIVERVLRSNYKIEQDLANKGQKLKELKPTNNANQKVNSLVNEQSSLQPRVLIKKLNFDQIQKKYSINNLNVLQNCKTDKHDSSPFINRKPGKRKLVMPKKYDDFSVNLPPGSDDDIRRPKKSIPDDEIRKRRKLMAEDIKKIKKESQSHLTLGSLILDPDSNLESSNDGHILAANTICNEISNDTLYSKSAGKFSSKNLEYTKIIEAMSPMEMSSNQIEALEPLQKPLPSFGRITKRVDKKAKSNPKSSKDPSRHLCGICSKEFCTNEEAQIHMAQHANDPNLSKTLSLPKTIGKPKSINSSILKPALTKESAGKTIVSPVRTVNKQSSVNKKMNTPKSLTNGDNNSSTLSKMQAKAKLMRCKRCQAIVEARHVKSHVCNSVKYNCNRCECSFGAEHLLVAHLDTHKERALEQEKKVSEELKRNKSQLSEEASIHDSSGKEMFSCFVCEKRFVDEEQMKDHLQMHCDESGEETNEKNFQCAFCSEKFQTEESLETHVGNHLLEDGDEKINMLINLENKRSEKKKDSLSNYKCELCDAEFSTLHFLSMHVTEHEENEEQEEHIALEQDFVCSVCDEVFDSPNDLNEHQEVHTGNSHVCILCEKPFASIEELQVHVSTHQ